MEYSKEWLDNFFDSVEDDVIKRRESTQVEFKQNFDWDSKEYRSQFARTAASLANCRGGIMLFGIKDRPHKISGIDNWGEVDSEQITTWLNLHFTPTIEYERNEYEYNGKTIGIIVVFESRNKPTVCIKDSARTNNADIYFRYNAKSEKIKSGDLIQLINETREEINSRWIDIISNIATIGVDNIGFFNFSDGTLTTNENKKFIIDEKLFDQIKYINRYSVEQEGQPAIRIIGEISESAHIVEKVRNLYEEDIYKAFLRIKTVGKETDYIDTILRQNTEYYPIYYFIKNSDLNFEEASKYITNSRSRTHLKKKLTDRIIDDGRLANKHNKYPLDTEIRGPKRKIQYEAVKNKESLEISNHEQCQDLFEALFNLERSEIDIDYLLNQLQKVFNTFYPFDEKNSLLYLFRWSLCYIDLIFYKEKL
jgi:hypothetical protein